ncbi:hypothetical protein EJ08DRAFT_318294 [Tothia fuscella]|uniref:ABM domain-containing protein n=1 Tax=Tothia fuscella TaxID=1048955 RepID=A0A9P4NMY0_9PEZI|nr:hypothetical protein EJ08DRAFT_318294 [Tothia fuscella]
MADSFIYIVARLKPAEGKTDELVQGLSELASEVEKNESGCVSYQFFVNEADGEIAIFEIYKDQEAVDAHKNSSHFKEAMKVGMEGKLAAPPNIQVIHKKGGFRRG